VTGRIPFWMARDIVWALVLAGRWYPPHRYVESMIEAAEESSWDAAAPG
jgi:hypothetical protein